MRPPHYVTLHFATLIAATVSLLGTSAVLTAESDSVEKPDDRARATAVALNYCRASFHRIRRYESQRVLLEEQQKILDNLNLSGINDEEVIRLYSECLDEIGQIKVSELESETVQDRFNRTLQRQVGSTAIVMAAQMATLSVEGFVRSGVNSWLDYRDLAWTREFDTLKIERNRIRAVVDKSSKFLDTFWKVAQERNIPDRWLVRGNDLDDLAAAAQEPDLTKRLRVLRRLEPYMECYPPYWYYVARTQQGLGQLFDAELTYKRTAQLGRNHFRRDDMLAAALANQAMIEVALGRDGADQTAREALRHSPDVWEANLMCALVLEQSGHFEQAEDAILRNVDSELETTRSIVALLGLCYRQERTDRLAEYLSDSELLAQVPVLSLVQCAGKLGREHTPPAAMAKLRQSLRVSVQPSFGADDLIVTCDPIWQPEAVSLRLRFPGRKDAPSTARPTLSRLPTGDFVFRFPDVPDGGSPLRPKSVSLDGVTLIFDYPGQAAKVPPLTVTLGPPEASRNAAPWRSIASPASIALGDCRVALADEAARPDPDDNIHARPGQRPRVTIIGVRNVPASGSNRPKKPVEEVPPPPES
jgi:tetratricopeptide (TPR) repeat protein